MTRLPMLKGWDDAVVQAASRIYDAMCWAARNAENGAPPPWMNGNSFAEGEARKAARDVIALASRDPEAAKLEMLVEALRKIAVGSKLGKQMFEARVHERKGRLTWYAVNVLQDNLDACAGTADAALTEAVS